MSTYTLSGIFILVGFGINGANVDAWKKSRFSGVPAKNSAPPSGSADAGVVVTDPSFGSDGSYQIAAPTNEDYYVRIIFRGQAYWELKSAVVFTDGTTGQVDVSGNPTVNALGFGFNKQYYVDSYLKAAGLAWTPTTDVGPYLRAALADAAAAGGGTVRLGMAVGGFTGKCQANAGVNVMGYGAGGQIGIGSVLRALDNTAALWFGSGDQTGANSGGGTSSNFMVDGGSSNFGDPNALIYSNLSVGRTFQSVWAFRGGGIGWKVEQSQNCVFLGCESLTNVGHGLVVDHGAAGNSFIRFEVSNSGGSALRYQESYWDAGAPSPQVFNNVFDHCIFERDTATTVDHVFINSAGTGTTFRDCAFQASLATSTYGIRMEPALQPGSGSVYMPVAVVMDGCSFTGTHKAMLLRNQPGLFLCGVTNNSTPTLITVDGGGATGTPGAHGAVNGRINSVASAIWAEINSGNTSAFQNFNSVPTWAFLDSSFASYAFRTSVSTDAGYRWQVEPTGAHDWNDGTSGSTMAQARLSDAKNAVHLSALALAAGGVVGGASGPPIYTGTAAPTTGAHVLGERVINTAPSLTGVSEWVCTTAGTPGTWTTVSVDGALVDLTTNQNIGGNKGFTNALLANGTFEILNRLIGHATTISATYTTVVGDFVVLITSGTFTVTLANMAAGQIEMFANAGSGVVTLTPTSGTIAGAASLILPARSGCIVFFDGTNYEVLGAYGVASQNTAISTPTIASGTAFTPNTSSNSELVVPVTTAGTVTFTWGPSTGAENTLFTSLSMSVGQLIQKYIPKGWKVVITLAGGAVLGTPTVQAI